jgi:hypothetical protein
MLRAVLTLINIFNSLMYDWAVKDEWKIIWLAAFGIVFDVCVWKKIYNKHLILLQVFWSYKFYFRKLYRHESSTDFQWWYPSITLIDEYLTIYICSIIWSRPQWSSKIYLCSYLLWSQESKHGKEENNI